jgi:iron complex outermembrane recepter protein
VLNRRNGGAGPIVPFYPGYIDDLARTNGPNAVEAFDDYSQGLGLSQSRSTYHEFRFFNDTAPLVYSVGGNYFSENQRNYLGSAADRNPFFSGLEFNTRTKGQAFAFFADATYSVTSRFRVTGGIRWTDDRKSRTGIAARYGFALGAADFNCCAGLRLGTPGFQFNGFGRTIFNPDVNRDGAISNQESVNFYLDGIRSFGSRDTFLPAFSNAIADFNAGNPNSARGGPGCFNSARLTYFFCAPSGNYTYAVPFGGQIFQQNGRVSSNFVDWRVRAEFDVGDRSLAYALISRGHKSAGFNDNLGDLGFSPTYRPESVTLFELGSKNRFDVGGHPITLNASLFYNDYRNQQLSALLSVAQIARLGVTPIPLPLGTNANLVVSYTFNAANVQTYGAQFDGSAVLPGGFKFGVNALWLEANVISTGLIQDFRFQSDVNSVDSVNRPINGNRLPRTPRYQINASLAQAIPAERFGGTFDWIVQGAWRSSSFQTIFNSIDYNPPATGPRPSLDDRLSGYVTFNAAVGFSKGEYRIEAYVNNFTDQTHAAALLVSQFANSRYYTNPRIFGFRVRAGF